MSVIMSNFFISSCRERPTCNGN